LLHVFSDDGHIHLFDDVDGCTSIACLHCTSVYVGHDNLSEAILQYSRCDTVSQSIGRVFRLMVTGIFFTPRTAGLRVLLTGIQRDLFTAPQGSNADVIQGRFVNSRSKQCGSPKKICLDLTSKANDLLNENENVAAAASCSFEAECGGCLQCTKDDSKLPHDTSKTVASKPVNESKDIHCTNESDDSTHLAHLSDNVRSKLTCNVIKEATSISGSANFSPIDTQKAHITLGFSKSSCASQTGLDLLEVIACESAKAVVNTISLDDENSIYYYGEGRCMVMFRHPVYVDALFSGCY